MKTQANKEEPKKQATSGNFSGTQGAHKPTFQFKDHRPEAVFQRKLQDMANDFSTSNIILKNFPNKFTKATNLYAQEQVVQGMFWEKNPDGSDVWWNRPQSLTGLKWRPWIDPKTGEQGKKDNYGIWFKFDKTGLDKQRVKGHRDPKSRNTPGLTLENENTYNARGALANWPGSRNWPNSMKGMHSSTNERGAVPTAIHGDSAWGHQLAKQWGGPANRDNAVSATNPHDNNIGKYAQEQYQTSVEDAVTKVSKDDGLPLDNFRIKHTAYKYSGTDVAKYVRIKIYRKGIIKGWNKVVDQVTPDFAIYMEGGRGDLTSALGKFQIKIENQLRTWYINSLKSKKYTKADRENSGDNNSHVTGAR